MSGLPSLQMPAWRDHALGALLALLQVLALAFTSDAVGIPRDESFYFDAADNAAGWVERLFDPQVASTSPEEIARGFDYNHEHPVLMKTLFGVSHRLFVERWAWIDDHRLGYRLPAMVLAGLAVWLTFLIGRMIEGRLAGLVAALALALVPTTFFHAHLACFDTPVMFMWLLVAYTTLRASRSLRWAPAAGLALGFGLATKLNVFFLPFVLLGVAVIDGWQHRRKHGSLRGLEGARGPVVLYAAVAVSMVVLGAAVFFGHWPWLWHDTVSRLRFYIGFHTHHVHYPVDYLGQLWWAPPFPVHFPFVFSALTMPLGIILLACVGLWVTSRRAWSTWKGEGADRHNVDLWLLANVSVPFAIIALPSTPIFGGTKHWMTAMPFVGVLAGVGLVRLARGLWPKLAEAASGAAGRPLLLRSGVLAACMLAPAAWATARYGVRGPVYFNELAGGAPGAAELRMPRNFWGYSTVDVLDTLNQAAEKGALVFWHKATSGSIQAYKRDGRLRRDVTWTGDWTAAYSNWAVYHDQREKLPEEVDVWRAYGTDWPLDGYFVDGVQVMAVYRRPGPPIAPPIPPGGR